MFGLAAASLIAGTTISMADAVAPLPAGGPVAQGEAGGIAPGTIIEIGGVLFAATIAGLVAINNDNSSPSTSHVPSPPTTGTPST